ncbi:MAG: hypothetical protein LBC35_05800 [Coriobacteriales bacterium]|jgi:hypothetical protein|nr:hypothetical protein [Coriobacteriales bacterium]
MLSLKKTLSIILTLTLAFACTGGALYYSAYRASAADTTSTAELDTTELLDDTPALSETYLTDATTFEPSADTSSTPNPDTSAPSPSSAPPLKPSPSNTPIGEEQPYWIQDTTYAGLIAAYEDAKATEDPNDLFTAAFEVTTFAPLAGDIRVGDRTVLANGTNAPTYNNASALLLTPLEGLPQEGTRSDRSLLHLLETGPGYEVYEATFYFNSNAYPASSFCALRTYVILDVPKQAAVEAEAAPTSAPDTDISDEPNEPEFVNISDSWPEFESLTEQLAWLRANGYADVADGYVASLLSDKSPFATLSPLVAGTGTPFYSTSQLSYTVTSWTNTVGGQVCPAPAGVIQGESKSPR